MSRLKGKNFHSIVRVTYENKGGTGILVNSLENGSGEYETYILTLYKNIEDAIEIEKKFDPLIGEERKMESRSQVEISLPTFKRELEVSGTRTLKGDIEAYSSKYNLAVVRLDDIQRYSDLSLIREKGPQSLEKVSVVGVGGRYGAPVILPSRVIAKNIREKGKIFDLVNGNYLQRRLGSVVISGEHFLGIVDSEISSVPDPEVKDLDEESTNLVIPLSTIKEWLEEEYLDFIFDEEVSLEKRKKEREEYKEKELMRRLTKAGLSEQE